MANQDNPAGSPTDPVSITGFGLGLLASKKDSKPPADKTGGKIGGKKEMNSKANHSPEYVKNFGNFPWYRLVIYDIFLWMFLVIFDCFFREIKTREAYQLPRSGPVIFVAAPHANQFVDPLLLMNQVKREANRRISFLIAAKLYRHPAIGNLSAAQLSIPVERAQDILKKGLGKIYVDFDADPYLVKGSDTLFTKECSIGGLLALPESLGASEILEIRSDTEIYLKKEFKRNDKIVKLLQKGTSYKQAPKVDQNGVYQLVFKHLSNGNCIGIFPEGGSHDRTDLLPLKAGVAIMALGAMSNDPLCNVKIVPCGMNYFNAHKFRSRAVIEFGAPIEIDSSLVAKYKNPETNREAVKDLLDIVTTGLKAVTVTCDDYETLMVVQASRRLYAGNFVKQLPLPLVVEMNRRLVKGYQTYKNEPMIQNVKEKILTYNKMLKQMYLPDHHVEKLDEMNKLRVLPVLIARIFTLFILGLLLLPGSILFSPVFVVLKIVSKKKQVAALANSSVKIKANDVVATWKILISMGFAPLLYLFYASLGAYYYRSYYSSISGVIGVWISLYLLGVAVTYSALLSGEQGMDLFKSIRPLYLSLTSGESVRELKSMRRELSEDITELVNTFGLQLFPNDFNLLEMKEKLKIDDNVEYVDSEEEEDRKTMALRERRKLKRKIDRKKRNKESDSNSESGLLLEHRSLLHSDGISLLNSDNSLSNIPMFSDYQLYANIKNPDFDASRLSAMQLTILMADDFNINQTSLPALLRQLLLGHIELNFGDQSRGNPKNALYNKIRERVRESREKSKED